jgi:RNA polymerase sigma factor (sigma-70 family)
MTLDSSDSTRPSLLLRLRAPEDREAWNTCVEVYGPLIYGHCRRAGLAHTDAEDVTQEVFARLSTAIRTFEYQPDLGRFRTWLGTVARNEISRFFKKQSRESSRLEAGAPLEQLADEREDGQWTAAFNGHVLRMALERCRPHFEAATWRAFERAWIDQCPAADVAREMSRAIDWVYVAKSRGLKALLQAVRELADDTILAVY